MNDLRQSNRTRHGIFDKSLVIGSEFLRPTVDLAYYGKKKQREVIHLGHLWLNPVSRTEDPLNWYSFLTGFRQDRNPSLPRQSSANLANGLSQSF